MFFGNWSLSVYLPAHLEIAFQGQSYSSLNSFIEFIMLSLLWRYHRSLWRLMVADGQAPMPIIARLTKHSITLLNIAKHSYNIVKHSTLILTPI